MLRMTAAIPIRPGDKSNNTIAPMKNTKKNTTTGLNNAINGASHKLNCMNQEKRKYKLTKVVTSYAIDANRTVPKVRIRGERFLPNPRTRRNAIGKERSDANKIRRLVMTRLYINCPISTLPKQLTTENRAA